MDPLITNGIDPALLRVLEKRGQERDPADRRKRPPVPGKPAEEEANKQEPDPDTPKHTLDDLA
jgi:hypothetical protein